MGYTFDNLDQGFGLWILIEMRISSLSTNWPRSGTDKAVRCRIGSRNETEHTRTREDADIMVVPLLYTNVWFWQILKKDFYYLGQQNLNNNLK